MLRRLLGSTAHELSLDSQQAWRELDTHAQWIRADDAVFDYRGFALYCLT